MLLLPLLFYINQITMTIDDDVIDGGAIDDDDDFRSRSSTISTVCI